MALWHKFFLSLKRTNMAQFFFKPEKNLVLFRLKKNLCHSAIHYYYDELCLLARLISVSNTHVRSEYLLCSHYVEKELYVLHVHNLIFVWRIRHLQTATALMFGCLLLSAYHLGRQISKTKHFE